MREEGEEAGVALRSSVSLSRMLGRFVTKSSSRLERRKREIRRRFSWALRSASMRAEAAPTPNTMPAEVGGMRRVRSSGIFSLSTKNHCLRIGIQPSFARVDVLAQKNRGSLYASEISFFHVLETSGSFDTTLRMSVVLEVTL